MRKTIIVSIPVLSLGLLLSSFTFNSKSSPTSQALTALNINYLIMDDDEDKDGVPDLWDMCPGTPAGVEVGPDGCPVVIPPAAGINPMISDDDEDKDGVPDLWDMCPGTPAGVEVGPDGCPVTIPPVTDAKHNSAEDEDQDGVDDENDRCPATPPGVKVGPDGCPEV